MNTFNERELLEKDYTIDIGKAFNVGSDILKKEIGGFIGFLVLQIIINLVFNKLTSGTFNRYAVNDTYTGTLALIHLIIGGLITPGNYYVAHKIRSRQETSFGDFFYGFSSYPAKFILLQLVYFIIVLAGTALLILPGIFMIVCYMFATCILVVYNGDFWQSLETSRKVISKIWGKAFLLLLAIIGINILGVLPCGLGLLYTIPLSYCIIYAAFHDIFKPGNKSMDDKISGFGQDNKDINTERDENNYLK